LPHKFHLYLIEIIVHVDIDSRLFTHEPFAVMVILFQTMVLCNFSATIEKPFVGGCWSDLFFIEVKLVMEKLDTYELLTKKQLRILLYSRLQL
jgi:hypothetical protein